MADAKRARRAATRGFATRTAERQHRMRQRLATAATTEQQLAASYDWFRSAASHVMDPAERARVMRETAAMLARTAADLEGRTDDCG